MEQTVCAVVVTHNRKQMLRKCLGALDRQRRAPDRILVVDNASSDGTQEMLEREFPHIDLLSLATNEGGAGGFHEGMKRAYELGAQYLWLLDDDTIPEPGALSELLAASALRLDGLPAPTVLASKVLWQDGRVHPMNFPTLERKRLERLIAGAEHKIVPMRAATFVSLLVHRGVLERHGLPFKHFFLWSDDIEYTSRVVLAGELAYFVPSSVAVHETSSADDFRAAPPERFYFHARNTLLIARGPGRPPRDRLIRLWVLLSSSAGYLVRHPNAAALAAVARGIRDGLRTRPS